MFIYVQGLCEFTRGHCIIYTLEYSKIFWLGREPKYFAPHLRCSPGREKYHQMGKQATFWDANGLWVKVQSAMFLKKLLYLFRVLVICCWIYIPPPFFLVPSVQNGKSRIGVSGVLTCGAMVRHPIKHVKRLSKTLLNVYNALEKELFRSHQKSLISLLGTVFHRAKHVGTSNRASNTWGCPNMGGAVRLQLSCPYAPCMEYLPTFAWTKSPSFVGQYTSTMVRIWDGESDDQLINQEIFVEHLKCLRSP